MAKKNGNKQAMAFLECILKGRPAVHLEAVLGHGNVPTLKDFEEYDIDGQERGDALLTLLKGYTEALWAGLERLEEIETKGSIPGTMPADLEEEQVR